MGLGYNSEESDKWWELLIAGKWPHEGFTVGFDVIQPNQNPDHDNMVYGTFIVYLGWISIIINWGKHSWNE